ncbi:MAG: hypothetical protein P4N60_03705 [Verrucomicrobiae bacterium]|nr:hypothetical protein [Verrucomicrobiae bacterium]
MKSTVLLLGAVVATFAITTFATEPLLSPRAAGNQIKHVAAVDAPATTITYVDANSALLTPRAAGNQIQVVKGGNNDVNAASACAKTMGGSPKLVAECTSHTTMPGCVTIAPLK